MILGLHGKMRSGKNECAKRLAQFSPLPVIEVSFAAKLKESAAALLDCSVDELEQWKNEQDAFVVVTDELGDAHPAASRRAQTVRSFLQRYGTEAHRDVFGQDFWLDAALPLPAGAPLTDTAGLRAFNARYYGDALYVVTDVRFENEAKRIRDLGGFVVRVIGPETETGSHASEMPIECDFAIDNTTRDDDFRSLDAQLQSLRVCF